jgi:hypothetical protein
MKKGEIDSQGMIPTHNQTTEGGEPGESAFDFEASAIATQLAAILGLGLLSIFTMRHNQVDAASGQTLAQGVAVIASVSNQPFRFLAGSAWPGTRHGNCFQGCVHQGHFRRGRSAQVDSQRNTLAVDHHHPLRALPALGFPDPGTPFFAGAKLPSIKASLHLSCLRSSSVAKNARHMSSQTSSSSHIFKRRQQVEGLGYSPGKSFHRAPVRNIHRMPSNTARLSAQGRPPRRDFANFGNSGSIRCHCLSVRNAFGSRLIGSRLR